MPLGSTVIGRVRVGCSGWNYKSWRGRFYPAEVPASRWLEYYAERFDTVEVNNTFYRLPERDTFEAWRRRVPSNFLAAIKASRFLTHMKRLRDPEEPLARLFSRASALGPVLGPVLYQLPASFTVSRERLAAFLDALPRAFGGRALRHVVEFRDPSWYVDDILALLDTHRVALCLHDKQGSAVEGPFVGPFVYVRFHGPTGTYAGSYVRPHLKRWAGRLADQARLGRDVFAYFNNDPDAAAVGNAITLRDTISELVVRRP
jgi:uncharacterized protein YecE (DUF72 family)